MSRQKKCVSSSDYKQLFIEKEKIYTSYCIFYYRNPYIFQAIKVSATKKVGQACQRNYYKRRVRHVLRELPIKKDVFVLAIVLKAHQMTFEDEKKYLTRKLRSLLG